MNSTLKLNAIEKQFSLKRGASKANPLSVAAILLASLLCVQAGPAGHWEADIKGDGPQPFAGDARPGQERKIGVDRRMGLPSANKTGLVVKDLVVNGNSVKFVALELMSARCDLTLGADGNMKGTLSGRSSQPVEFKRTGEAKVELIPASPAVSKELEGDWEGSLKMPNGAFRMVFHFKNQPDKTALTTFDTPSATNLPLNDVKQTGRKVEFGMRIAHGSFQGTLNKEGTGLAGQFTHEENSAPLTLQKKPAQPAK